jgi:hypothetical protein
MQPHDTFVFWVESGKDIRGMTSFVRRLSLQLDVVTWAPEGRTEEPFLRSTLWWAARLLRSEQAQKRVKGSRAMGLVSTVRQTGFFVCPGLVSYSLRQLRQRLERRMLSKSACF